MSTTEIRARHSVLYEAFSAILVYFAKRAQNVGVVNQCIVLGVSCDPGLGLCW